MKQSIENSFILRQYVFLLVLVSLVFHEMSKKAFYRLMLRCSNSDKKYNSDLSTNMITDFVALLKLLSLTHV